MLKLSIMTNMIDLSKPNLGGEGHKQRIKTEWWWMNIYEHPPPFCETKHHSNKSFNAAVISLRNRIIKQFKTVSVEILSDWFVV